MITIDKSFLFKLKITGCCAIHGECINGLNVFYFLLCLTLETLATTKLYVLFYIPSIYNTIDHFLKTFILCFNSFRHRNPPMRREFIRNYFNRLCRRTIALLPLSFVLNLLVSLLGAINLNSNLVELYRFLDS